MKRKRSFILSLLALILILCAFIQPAWAYFTTSSQAAGATKVYYKRVTTITEDPPTGNIKTVTIHNDADSTVWVWIRAKARTGEQFKLTGSGTDWSEPDKEGWYYYQVAVEPGGKTKPLSFTLDLNGVEPPDVVNVGVVYESVTAFYNPKYDPSDPSSPMFESPEWDATLDNGTA